MEKIKEEFNFKINGKAIDVVKVDTDSAKGCMILTHPDGTESELYLHSGIIKTPH